MKKIISILLLLLFLGNQYLEAQGIHGYWRDFFYLKDYAAYRTICRLYAPNSEFIRGDFQMSSIDSPYTLTAKVNTDEGTIYVTLYSDPKKYVIQNIDISTSIEVSPSENAKVLKAFASEMLKKYNTDAIKWIEKQMGKTINKMNKKELCIADLTLFYWTCPIRG